MDESPIVLTPVLLRRSGVGWRPRPTRLSPPAVGRPQWTDWPRRAWWPTTFTVGERTEMVLRPSSGVLVRRTRSRWSTATSVFTSERTELLRTISRPGRWVPVAEVVRREYARRPDQAAARPVPPAGPGRTGSATLTVTVLRAIRTPTREVHQIRTLRVEPGQAGAPGSVGSTGPAGPATIHTNTVLARHPTPATPPAGPVHATPVSVLTPANPAPETGPGWADEHIEEVAARVLRSIERRAVAQRERLGRG